MRIFEILWLIAAIIALTMAITRGIKGQAYGSYIYITIFTTCVAAFMYYYKKKHRKYLENYYRQKEEKARYEGNDKME